MAVCPSPKSHAYWTMLPSGSWLPEGSKVTGVFRIGLAGMTVNEATGGWFGVEVTINVLDRLAVPPKLSIMVSLTV